VVNQIVLITNLNHNVVQTVPFQLVLVIILVVNINRNLKNSIKNKNTIIGACCDDGSCKLTLGSSECSTGLFQGFGSNCGGDTCPLGNVCCQNDEDQPCLTDIDAVEDCTGAGQFAAENCNECLVRFAQLNLIVSSESNEISLSGAG